MTAEQIDYRSMSDADFRPLAAEYEATRDRLEAERREIADTIAAGKKKWGTNPAERRLHDKIAEIIAHSEANREIGAEAHRRRWRESFIDKVNRGVMPHGRTADFPELEGTEVMAKLAMLRAMYHRMEAYTKAVNALGPMDVLNERQTILVDAVEAAMDAGLFYESDMRARIAAAVAGVIPADELAAKTRNTEGGDFGYEVYTVRKFVESRRAYAKSLQDRETLAPVLPMIRPGARFSNLTISRKRYQRVTVTTVDGDIVSLHLVNGRAHYSTKMPTIDFARLAAEAGPVKERYTLRPSESIQCAKMYPDTDCSAEPIEYIDTSGFVYCDRCGFRRQQSEPCRRLTDTEKRRLERGEQIERY